MRLARSIQTMNLSIERSRCDVAIIIALIANSSLIKCNLNRLLEDWLSICARRAICEYIKHRELLSSISQLLQRAKWKQGMRRRGISLLEDEMDYCSLY